MPILIRAGKCMPVTATEIAITFKPPPQDVFGIEPMAPEDRLRFRIWPETAVSLTLHGKKPGAGWEPQAEELSFAQQPGSDIRPYDRLIGAALDGDRWLFARQDTVEAAWKIVDPVLGDAVPVHPYAQGSWGPNEADRLLPDRDAWHDPAGPWWPRARVQLTARSEGEPWPRHRPAPGGDHRRRLRGAVRRPGAARGRRSR